MKTAELYRSVTDRIVRELEQGAAPWIKPWKSTTTAGGVMPVNAVTGRAYSGINVPILWGEQHGRGYLTARWLTFRQALEKGAAVRKGEKGTHVVFTKRITVGEDNDERQIAMLRTYVVFNAAQVDGLPDPPPTPEARLEDRLEAVEGFIGATRAELQHGGDRACYVPSRDFIAMPPFGSFRAPEHYYATALHELAHWTGHSSRLDRDLGNRFGSRAYAAEELIAELGAAFLCAQLGITGELRHAGYIASWIELLKEDDRAIFTAASKASQAADFLRAFSEP